MEFKFSNSVVEYNIGGEREAEVASFANDVYKNVGVENLIYIQRVIIGQDDTCQRVISEFCSSFNDYIIVWCIGEKGLKGARALQAQFVNRIIAENIGFEDLSFYYLGDEDLRYMLYLNKPGKVLLGKLTAFYTVVRLHDILLDEVDLEVFSKTLKDYPLVIKNLQKILDECDGLRSVNSF